MTPMDFRFRDLLVPASGFQSVQFREIEIGLGINENQRPDTKQYNFMGRLSKEDQDHLKIYQKKKSVLPLLKMARENSIFRRRKF